MNKNRSFITRICIMTFLDALVSAIMFCTPTAYAQKAPDYTPSLQEIYGTPDVQREPASVLWHITNPANTSETVVLTGRWCESRKGMLQWFVRDFMGDAKASLNTYTKQALYAEVLDSNNRMVQQGCWLLQDAAANIAWNPAKGKRTTYIIPLTRFQRINN